MLDPGYEEGGLFLDRSLNQKKVRIYADGACQGNPGPGGWATILLMGGWQREIYGYDPDTTNNRMEMTAAIVGLASLTEPCSVELFSDSSYLVKAFQQHWLEQWQRKGWRKPVKNADLWRELLALTAHHEVKWTLIRGHSGIVHNERCDTLAKNAISDKAPFHKGPLVPVA